MYVPEPYRIEDPKQIRDFLRRNPFGILVSSGREGPMATHLPLEFGEGKTGKALLRGHFAKANPQWRQIPDGAEVLCIFNGPHAYVSSSWYQEEEVPTWNYMAVHVRGRYRKQSLEELWEALHQMVDKYERGSKDPVSLEAMSPNTLRQVRGIVGFEIEVTSWEAAFKLSQGREQDHARIITELQERGGNSAAVAKAMMSRKKP